MALPLKKNEVSNVYREALRSLLGTISRLEDDGRLHDPENFNSIVKLSLTRLGLSASDLARDEGISKGAISKWLNEDANPNNPTKKVVIEWIRQAAQTQLDCL